MVPKDNPVEGVVENGEEEAAAVPNENGEGDVVDDENGDD